MSTPGLKLREAMDAGVVMAPGAFNGLVGRMVRQAGFSACYVSGGAITAASGVPDIGICGLDFFTAVIRQVAAGARLPILADADTGFENPRQTVWAYVEAGAAGLHIEDQPGAAQGKKCGHLGGKVLVQPETMIARIQEAVSTAHVSPDPHFVVCARTDARGVDGLDAAVERALAYVEAGAHMIFPEGLESLQEFRTFAAAMRATGKRIYLLANMTEFGKSPLLSASTLGELGYHLVIYPVSTLRVAMAREQMFLKRLKATGTTEGDLDEMLTREKLYQVLGYDPKSTESWDPNAA